MSAYAGLIPVNILTGALGSGKTTLLEALLRAPRLAQTAVLVNELGEVGIDHHLIEHASESTLLLENGCLCCAMRDDLKSSLLDLHSRRERREIPRYERVVIETSGVADPVPIAYTLVAEPVLMHHYRLGNVVTVVDAVNALQQLERFEASVKQVALADRLVLSKCDLAGADEERALRSRLAALNPAAPTLESGSSRLDPVDLLVADPYETDAKAREIAGWRQRLEAAGGGAGSPHGSVEAHCFTFERALDWTAFGIWMTMLLHRHGDRVLRIKGLLDVAGVPGPVLVNGVQHVVHPPAHLEAWPDTDRRSRIVVILDGLRRDAIETSLAAFNAIANPEGGVPQPQPARRRPPWRERVRSPAREGPSRSPGRSAWRLDRDDPVRGEHFPRSGGRISLGVRGGAAIGSPDRASARCRE